MREEPSRTAEYVGLCRASEQRRPAAERIVDDPYAEWFLGGIPRSMLAGMRLGGGWWRGVEARAPSVFAYVLARHRFIDDALLRALAAGTEQVVILGAGYDSRAYRMSEALSGRPVFELDFPSTSQRKRDIIKQRSEDLPAANVRHVPIDFLSEKIANKLIGAGFEARGRSFFVWEGVSMYLTREAVKDTLSTIAELSGAGSQLAMDLWSLPDQPSLAGTVQRTLPNLLHLFGEPMGMSLHPEDAGPFLDRLGFALVDLAGASELERRYVTDARRVYPDFYLVLAQNR